MDDPRIGMFGPERRDRDPQSLVEIREPIVDGCGDSRTVRQAGGDHRVRRTVGLAIDREPAVVARAREVEMPLIGEHATEVDHGICDVRIIRRLLLADREDALAAVPPREAIRLTAAKCLGGFEGDGDGEDDRDDRDGHTRCGVHAAAVVSRRRLPAHAVDDVRQTVRERLLGGDPPYLATAVGRGSLAGLVAVIATRAALDWLRAKQRAEAHLDETPAELVASSTPEREHLRSRFSGDVKAAFEAAVKDLEARDRTMLRFHLVEGMTIDEVAHLYQIHRATAARQIERARDRVASGVRKALERATGIRADELRELTGLVTSQLDLSLSHVLAASSN